MTTTTLPRRFGRYTLVRRLATGGMAEVYLATTRGAGGFEKRVAVKCVHPHLPIEDGHASALAEEAKLSARLAHPNIIRVFDLGRAEGIDFLVMEHVEGHDAQRVLDCLRESGRSFPIDLAAYVIWAVCRALDYAHRQRDPDGRLAGIVHRDVSPQNILLSFAGEVKLADFGIARTEARRSEPDANVIKGKYFYMSPEQASAQPLDHRTDVFASGVVLWELLVGRRLHEAENVPALLDAVRKARILPPSSIRTEVPTALDTIVARATARDPAGRFPDAGAMADALQDYLARRPSIDVQAAMAALVAGVSGAPAVPAPQPPDLVPRTRDRAPPSALGRSAPIEALSQELEDGEPTVAGWQIPRSSRSHFRWGWALLGGSAFVVLAAWLLHGA